LYSFTSQYEAIDKLLKWIIPRVLLLALIPSGPLNKRDNTSALGRFFINAIKFESFGKTLTNVATFLGKTLKI